MHDAMGDGEWRTGSLGFPSFIWSCPALFIDPDANVHDAKTLKIFAVPYLSGMIIKTIRADSYRSRER